MRASELRELDRESLEKELEEAYRELFNLRFRLAIRQLTNFREIRKVKKKIARIKTIIRERELTTPQKS